MRRLATAVLLTSVAALGDAAVADAEISGVQPRTPPSKVARLFRSLSFDAVPPAPSSMRAVQEALTERIELERRASVQRYCGMPVMRVSPSLDERMVKKIDPEVLERVGRGVIEPTVCAKPDEPVAPAVPLVKPARP